MLEPIAGPLLRGLGVLLAFLYDLIRSYGLAIVLLTVLVRLVLLPLTIRQTRSMQAMQKLQPKVKELQRKYKGNRQKLTEETQKLYREHQVNPLGGCLPLLLQLPVFFALFSVLRATEGAFAVPAEPIRPAAVEADGTVCLPNTPPSIDGATATAVECRRQGGEEASYPIEGWRTKNSRTRIDAPPPSLAICPRPNTEGDRVTGFLCESVQGPGHLPENSDLFAAIVGDQAEFLGMELGCSPTQALDEVGFRLCAGPAARGGIVTAIPYFLLVGLMIGTTYYQTKQMQRASSGPAAQQQQLMARIMPIFLGFISISISAGVLVYWVTTNAWQIGQQHLMLRRTQETPTVKGKVKESSTDPAKASEKSGGTPNSTKKVQGDGSKRSGGRGAGSRKKRRKR